MSAPGLAPDPVDAAIAAASAPAPVAMGELRMQLASGRPAIVACPVDATDAEILEIIAALTIQLRAAVANMRQPSAAGRLVLPR